MASAISLTIILNGYNFAGVKNAEQKIVHLQENPLEKWCLSLHNIAYIEQRGYCHQIYENMTMTF